METSKELSTKRQWDAKRWHVASGRASGNKEDARNLNAYLDSLYSKVLQAKKKLMDSDKEINAERLKNVLLGKDEDTRMILKIFEEHNKQVEALVGRDFAAGTSQRYKTSLDHTRSFIQWKYGVDDLDIQSLDYEFISNYAFWLKSIRNCGQNSTAKYLANFKKIVLICIKNGWLRRDPFIGFKLVKKEVNRVVLSNEELKRIAERQFGIERLEQVRDIFLFSCYTGLAYIDVKELKRSQVITGIDGEQWIITSRKNAGT
ncbi:MAG: site-specific integrase [Anditalea sp.]